MKGERGIPQEDMRFSADKKRGKLSRLKRRVGDYVKIALVVGIAMMPTGLRAETGSGDPAEGNAKVDTENKRELNQDEKSQLREMQQFANQMMEMASMEFSKVTDEELNDFQQKAWDLADQVVRSGGNLEGFRYALQQMYAEAFSGGGEEKPDSSTSGAQESQPTETPEAEQPTISPVELDSSVDLSDEWMVENTRRIFRQGNKLLVVAVGSSLDMQIAADKADMRAEGIMDLLKKQEKATGVPKRARQVTLKRGNRYEVVMLYEMEIE
ncbi:hypothetical protein ACFL0L_03720 [Patescibacteria group bacterium]